MKVLCIPILLCLMACSTPTGITAEPQYGIWSGKDQRNCPVSFTYSDGLVSEIGWSIFYESDGLFYGVSTPGPIPVNFLTLDVSTTTDSGIPCHLHVEYDHATERWTGYHSWEWQGYGEVQDVWLEYTSPSMPPDAL